VESLVEAEAEVGDEFDSVSGTGGVAHRRSRHATVGLDGRLDERPTSSFDRHGDSRLTTLPITVPIVHQGLSHLSSLLKHPFSCGSTLAHRRSIQRTTAVNISLPPL
jgi:hypothetical protein